MLMQCAQCGRVKLQSGGFPVRSWDGQRQEWWGVPAFRRVIPETDKVDKVMCPECLRKMSTGIEARRK